jgi:hypothetical protein
MDLGGRRPVTAGNTKAPGLSRGIGSMSGGQKIGLAIGLPVALVWAVANFGGLPESERAAPVNRPAVSVEGLGFEDSRRFELAGDYAVWVKVTPRSDVGCYHGASLRRASDGRAAARLSPVDLDDAAPRSVLTNVYDLEPDTYYVSANSGCRWVYDFRPQ